MQKFFLGTAEISRDISSYTIGFASLSANDIVEDATSAGCGTLSGPRINSCETRNSRAGQNWPVAITIH